MSLENLQTLSKLNKKNMRAVHRLFFDFFGVAARIFFLEKVVHAYFSEFGGSLEILQTHFFGTFSIFWGEKTRILENFSL